MKPSTSSSAAVDDDDLELSHILLRLPNLISESKFRSRFHEVKWAARKRRSAVDLVPPPLPLPPPPPPPICPPSSSLPLLCRPSSSSKPNATSPVTPLDFSHVESSYEKPKHSLKKKVISKKRTKEELLKKIDRLLHCRENLTGEIEKVRKYHDKLKAINLELKAEKQEKERLNQHVIQSAVVDDHPHIHHTVHQQQCIVDQSAHGSHTSENFHQYPYGQTSSGSRLVKPNRKGPLGVIDTNMAAEQTSLGMDAPQPLDQIKALMDKKAKAAEARRRRMIKIKEMKSLAAVEPPKCLKSCALRSA